MSDLLLTDGWTGDGESLLTDGWNSILLAPSPEPYDVLVYSSGRDVVVVHAPGADVEVTDRTGGQIEIEHRGSDVEVRRS